MKNRVAWFKFSKPSYSNNFLYNATIIGSIKLYILSLTWTGATKVTISKIRENFSLKLWNYQKERKNNKNRKTRLCTAQSVGRSQRLPYQGERFNAQLCAKRPQYFRELQHSVWPENKSSDRGRQNDTNNCSRVSIPYAFSGDKIKNTWEDLRHVNSEKIEKNRAWLKKHNLFLTY